MADGFRCDGKALFAAISMVVMCVGCVDERRSSERFCMFLLEFDVHEAEIVWFLKLTIWRWGPHVNQSQSSCAACVGVKASAAARNVEPRTRKQDNDRPGDVKSCWKVDERVITRMVDGGSVFTHWLPHHPQPNSFPSLQEVERWSATPRALVGLLGPGAHTFVLMSANFVHRPSEIRVRLSAPCLSCLIVSP